MLEPDLRPHGRQPARGRLRPFDEHDRVLEVRLEVRPLGGGDRGEAVQVEVRDVWIALVAMADRVGGARDGSGHAERTAGAPDEGRLSGAELARDGHDVTE